jgi:serine/threonine protein kinase
VIDPLLGRTIAGRYRVTGKIGAGGMGAVYAAVQDPLGRQVAIKVLKPTFASHDVAVARFKKEAAIVSGLSHPNIVTLHDFGETDDGLLYIVMEFLKGATLARVVRGEGPMRWERSVPIVQDIARALSAAHALGVIHRDLKLDNLILVNADGDRDFVKILDFGVAKTLHEDESSPSLTETDHSPGTPGYMSPELARGITHDPRSDFYALGVVWFEMLTCRRPFTARNAMDVFLQQMTQAPPRIRDVAPQYEVPDSIDELIQRLLDKDPNKRPKDTTEILDATFAIAEKEGLSTRVRRATSDVTLRRPDTKSDSDSPQTVPTLDVEQVLMPTMVGALPPMTGEVAQPLATPGPSEEYSGDHSSPTESMIAVAPVTLAMGLVPPTQDVSASPRSKMRAALAVAIGVAVVAVGFTVNATRKNDDDEHHLEAGFGAAQPYTIRIDKPIPKKRDAPVTTSQAPRVAAAPVDVSSIPPPVAESARAEPVQVVAAEPPPPDLNALKQRLAAVNDRMRERFLLADDVPDFRRMSAQAEDDIKAGRGEQAASTIAQIEANVSAIKFTDAFIRQKIARIDAGIPKDWPSDAAMKAELMNLRANVHERFGARDLIGANLALNRLWLFSLKAPRPKSQ